MLIMMGRRRITVTVPEDAASHLLANLQGFAAERVIVQQVAMGIPPALPTPAVRVSLYFGALSGEMGRLLAYLKEHYAEQYGAFVESDEVSVF